MMRRTSAMNAGHRSMPDVMGDAGSGRLLDVAALLIGLAGTVSILYAGFLAIPPFSDVPVPLVWQAYGGVALVGAVGVARRRTWGRALGILVTATGLGLALLRQGSEFGRSASPAALLDLGITVALDLAVVWVLSRRWPRGDR
jgi:hypothetical protein